MAILENIESSIPKTTGELVLFFVLVVITAIIGLVVIIKIFKYLFGNSKKEESIEKKLILRNLKGGSKKMPRKKKLKAKDIMEEIDQEDFDDDEGYISELDNGDEEEEEEKESDNPIDDLAEELDKLKENHGKAIQVNQKYIKKIWDEVKGLKDNFKLLIESKLVL